MLTECVVVDLHETALPDGRHGLEGDGVAGPTRAAEPEGGQAGADGTRRDDHHLVAVVAQGGDLAAELGDGGGAHLAVGVGDR